MPKNNLGLSVPNFSDGPHAMPGWLQAFVRVNPVTHLVTADPP